MTVPLARKVTTLQTLERFQHEALSSSETVKVISLQWWFSFFRSAGFVGCGVVDGC